MKILNIKAILVFSFFALNINFLVAQTPSAFKYQAVARDAANSPYQNQTISFRIAIIEGGNLNSEDGVRVYVETHQTTTNDLGLVSLNIGMGTSVMGDFLSINWSTGAYLMEVGMDVNGGTDYTFMGRSQLLATPYALHAKTVENSDDADADPQNEIQELIFDVNTNQLSISGGNSVSIPTGGTDADADPENEIQTLNFDANTNQLSITNGNSVIIPTGGTDADADPVNELQTITQDGLNVMLSKEGGSINIADNDNDAQNEIQRLSKNGNTISLSNNGGMITDAVNDADANPENELQSLSFNQNTNELSISEGNSVIIPTGGTDADADPANELQTISKNGNTISLSNNGGMITDEVNDADADPANELQTISKSGNTISLSNNGGMITDAVNDADADPANELQSIRLENTNLSISDGNTIDLKVLQDGVNDADANPENELQSLSFNQNTNELSISEGNSVIIPTGGTDADADPANELQTISKSGNTISLSNNGGMITDEVNDADANPENELQSLSFNQNTNELSISEGNSVIIPTGGTDADADPANELQTISKNGNTISLSNNGGMITDEVNDADANPANELQAISKNGNMISLSNNGGTITDEVNDADADSSNELQRISKSGHVISLSNNGGTIIDSFKDADADPKNELQTLNFNQSTNLLTITDGNAITLPLTSDGDGDAQNELQTLSLNNTTLAISEGNSIDLSAVQDGVNDADADPANELQTLTFDGYFLDISGGNSVSFLNYTTPWSRTNNNISYLTGTTITSNLETKELTATGPDLFGKFNASGVSFNNTFANKNLKLNLTDGLKMESPFSFLQLDLFSMNYLNKSSSIATSLFPGEVRFFNDRAANQPNAKMNSESVFLENNGITSTIKAGELKFAENGLRRLSLFRNQITMYHKSGNLSLLIGSNQDNTGFLQFYNDDARRTVGISSREGKGELGLIEVSGKNNTTAVEIYAANNNYGIIRLAGQNNKTNVALGAFGTNNNGFVGVYDSNGSVQAGLRINGSGQGEIFADLKNFRMLHPKQKDKEIWYASLEGPEAGAYERGTAQLTNGEVIVLFSDHFQMVGNSESMTVQLTPLSADTYGLAVIEKLSNGFKVKELAKGKGNFKFDWEVKCVRKGFEQYKVIRKRENQTVEVN